MVELPVSVDSQGQMRITIPRRTALYEKLDDGDIADVTPVQERDQP